VHKKINTYECSDCDFKCHNKGSFNRHLKRIHIKLKNYFCDECDWKFVDKYDLTRHQKNVHLKIQHIECNFCEYKCGAVGNMNRHIKSVHQNIRDFKCNFCDLKFSLKRNLDCHIKAVHKKIKDFECKECEYKSSTKGTLTKHIKYKHTFERPFKCLDENCDMKFVINRDMKNHFNNIHTLEGRLRQKKRENRVYNHIFVKNDINCQREMQIDFKCLYNEDEKENRQNTKFCRIDFYSVLNNFILFMECDEHSHMDYDVSCEVSRMMKIQESMVLQDITKPIVWIRFNPDSFKIDDTTQKILFNDRAKTVVDFIKIHQPSNDLEIHYFFYDQYKIDDIQNYTSSNDIKELFHYH
jgi:hypothetical protein